MRTAIWRYVLKKLTEYSMFTGCYDARNGSDLFMYGVMAVMEYIAERAGKFAEFEETFATNMTLSKVKASRNKRAIDG